MRGGQQGGSCSRNWARWVSPGGCHPVGITKGIKQLTGPGSFREKKPSPTWGLAATEGVCARLWECLVQGQAFLCNQSQTKRGFNPGWRDGMEPDPEKFKCQTLPTFSPVFSPEGGSSLSSPQWCREEFLFQHRVVKCSLKREGRGHG